MRIGISLSPAQSDDTIAYSVLDNVRGNQLESASNNVRFSRDVKTCQKMWQLLSRNLRQAKFLVRNIVGCLTLYASRNGPIFYNQSTVSHHIVVKLYNVFLGADSFQTLRLLSRHSLPLLHLSVHFCAPDNTGAYSPYVGTLII